MSREQRAELDSLSGRVSTSESENEHGRAVDGVFGRMAGDNRALGREDGTTQAGLAVHEDVPNDFFGEHLAGRIDAAGVIGDVGNRAAFAGLKQVLAY